jgi:hypothetical protein
MRMMSKFLEDLRFANFTSVVAFYHTITLPLQVGVRFPAINTSCLRMRSERNALAT